MRWRSPTGPRRKTSAANSAEAIKELKRRTGAARVALVGNSRGGNPIRSYIKNGGGADVSHALLCGVPNHGIFDWDDLLGNEFNGRGPFLRGLNEGDSEVTPGTAFLTLRSDGIDKYAQSDGRFVGKPGTPTGITPDGPALKGATNLVLGAVDHRETAFHPRAFREIYKFIAGREPAPDRHCAGNGRQTERPCDGHAGRRSNQPPGGGRFGRLHRVSPDTGERLGASRPLLANRCGRALGSGAGRSHLVSRDRAHLARLDHHAFYRSPFPRSSDIVHLRAARPLGPADAGAGAVVILSRPRGYFGLPRDVVLLDGQGAKGRQSRRPDRFDHHLAASGRGGRARRRRAVQ